METKPPSTVKTRTSCIVAVRVEGGGNALPLDARHSQLGSVLSLCAHLERCAIGCREAEAYHAGPDPRRGKHWRIREDRHFCCKDCAWPLAPRGCRRRWRLGVEQLHS